MHPVPEAALARLRRIIVAIDPAVTHGEESDETGILVVARGPHQDRTCKLVEMAGRCPGHGYVLDDLSCRVPPHEWARVSVAAYKRWHADRIVAEVNNGGDMVGETIHAVEAGVPYTAVRASRGKRIRAEPIAALEEQGRLHYMGEFPELEYELTTWTQESDTSPNRLDAMVWGFTALGLIGTQADAFIAYWKGEAKAQAARPTTDRDRHERQISRMLRGAPRFGERPAGETTSAQKRCAHRWRGARCLFCGLIRETA